MSLQTTFYDMRGGRHGGGGRSWVPVRARDADRKVLHVWRQTFADYAEGRAHGKLKIEVTGARYHSQTAACYGSCSRRRF